MSVATTADRTRALNSLAPIATIPVMSTALTTKSLQKLQRNPASPPTPISTFQSKMWPSRKARISRLPPVRSTNAISGYAPKNKSAFIRLNGADSTRSGASRIAPRANTMFGRQRSAIG